MSYTFSSNLHISPIFNGVSMQMESKWNTDGRQFKWPLLNTSFGTIYHNSKERNLKRILKKIFYLNANGIDLKCISFLAKGIVYKALF